MWEYRIFRKSQDSSFQEEILTATDYQYLAEEHRTDIYYNLKRPEFGLKERWESQTQVYLELKVRMEATTWGAELWNKCIKKQCNPADFPTAHVDKYLTTTIYEGDSSCTAHLTTVNKLVTDDLPHQIAIEKHRRQFFGLSRRVQVEVVELTLETQDYESLCVESSQLEAVQLAVTDLGLNELGSPMGYPQFIHSIIS